MLREEIRKKTGIQIDGWGNKKQQLNDNKMFSVQNKNETRPVKQIDKDYRDITSYKPSGNLIYNPELLILIKA